MGHVANVPCFVTLAMYPITLAIASMCCSSKRQAMPRPHELAALARGEMVEILCQEHGASAQADQTQQKTAIGK